MKIIITATLLLSLLFVQNAFSANIPNTISGPLKDVYCSEVDPFIGDQCIIYTTDIVTGKKFGLVFEDYTWAMMHIPTNKTMNDYTNELFEVEFCDPLYDRDLILEYKRINSDYFYVTCNENLFSWQNQTFIKNTVIKNISAIIDTVWCGELNPQTADVCVIKAKDKKTNKEYLFLFEDFEWMNKYLKNDKELETLNGQSFKISSCERTSNIHIVSEFNKSNRDNVYRCPINNFSWQ